MKLLVLIALLAGGLGHHQKPPPLRHARPASRIVYWVCPMAPDGSPVVGPGLCFHEFAGR